MDRNLWQKHRRPRQPPRCRIARPTMRGVHNELERESLEIGKYGVRNQDETCASDAQRSRDECGRAQIVKLLLGEPVVLIAGLRRRKVADKTHEKENC